MVDAAQVKSERKSAEERRIEVIRAAIEEFALRGLDGGSTETIARLAGISQPYVLRLFGTKKALFLAAVESVCDEILRLWQVALDRHLRVHPEAPVRDRIDAIGHAFYELVDRRVELRLVLQSYAAAHDPEVRALTQQRMDRLFSWVREATGAPTDVTRAFFATGMALMVAASIHAVEVAETQEWARAFLKPAAPAETSC